MRAHNQVYQLVSFTIFWLSWRFTCSLYFLFKRNRKQIGQNRKHFFTFLTRSFPGPGKQPKWAMGEIVIWTLPCIHAGVTIRGRYRTWNTRGPSWRDFEGDKDFFFEINIRDHTLIHLILIKPLSSWPCTAARDAIRATSWTQPMTRSQSTVGEDNTAQ